MRKSQKEILTDFDLDAQNFCNVFPKGEEHAFIYIRGSVDDNDVDSVFVGKCYLESLAKILLSVIEKNDDIRSLIHSVAVMDSVKNGNENTVLIDGLFEQLEKHNAKRNKV